MQLSGGHQAIINSCAALIAGVLDHAGSRVEDNGANDRLQSLLVEFGKSLKSFAAEYDIKTKLIVKATSETEVRT